MLQNMLRTKFKNQQKEHERTKIYMFQNFQFPFIIEFLPKIFLSKHNYAAVQMIRWLSSVSVPTVCAAFGPTFFYFQKLFFTAS